MNRTGRAVGVTVGTFVLRRSVLKGSDKILVSRAGLEPALPAVQGREPGKSIRTRTR